MSRLWPALLLLLTAIPVAVFSGCGNSLIGGGRQQLLAAMNLYSTCAVADLNGDGALDIALAYAKVNGPPPHPGVIAVYLQDPSRPGKFLVPTYYAAPNDPWGVTIGDLNADGKPDIVVVNTIAASDSKGSSSVSVLLQDPAHPGQFLSASNYPTGFSPLGVAIGDLNGDGRPDLAVADSTGVSVLLQSSTNSGQFLPLIKIPVGDRGTSAVALADLNGDGKLDIAAASTALEVLLQNSAVPGNFLPPVHYPVGAQPYGLIVQDLNGDRHPDIAIANLGSVDGSVKASLSVVLQDPGVPGTFQPAVSYATGESSWTVAAADLDGDGNQDLVVGNMGSYGGSSISVFLQQPSANGTFNPATNYSENGNVGWVAPADIDHDGFTDLVIVTDQLEIRFQDVSNPGTFLPPVVVASPSS